MNPLKLKRISTKLLLAVSGAVYLTIFANLDLNVFVKSYAAIMPVQLLALIYGLHLIYQSKVSRKQERPPKP